MKKLSWTVLVISMMFLVACGGKEESSGATSGTSSGGTSPTISEKSTEKTETKDELVIAGIYKAGDQTWFIDEGKAAEAAAKKAGADKFIYIDAKMDPSIYLSALENVIAQKVDGVLVCIPDQNMSELTLEKLNEAGIPVVAADDPLQDQAGNKIAPWVGISAYKIGRDVGEWVVAHIKDQGLENDPEVGYLILTMDTVSSVVPRTDGEYDAFIEGLPNFDENRIFWSDYNGETDKGYNAAAAIFTANPQIKKWYVVGGNEEGVVGAVRALEQAGLDKDAVAVGMGAYLAVGEFEKDYSALKAAPYFSSVAVGGDSARLLVEYILHGTEIPMETAVDAVIVTKETYKEIMQ